jgi:hypothetical protein
MDPEAPVGVTVVNKDHGEVQVSIQMNYKTRATAFSMMTFRSSGRTYGKASLRHRAKHTDGYQI